MIQLDWLHLLLFGLLVCELFFAFDLFKKLQNTKLKLRVALRTIHETDEKSLDSETKKRLLDSEAMARNHVNQINYLRELLDNAGIEWTRGWRRLPLVTMEDLIRERHEESQSRHTVTPENYGFVQAPGGKFEKRKTVTEQEAAISFVHHIREKVERSWPSINSNFKDAFGDKFVIENESKAKFDLALAAIAQDLQAVKNLFSVEQAGRLERWVLKNIGGIEQWGDYAVSEIREYSSAFQNKRQTGIPIDSISARMLHGWLGHGIINFEMESGGEKNDYIDPALTMAATETLAKFIGFWKGIKNSFPIVEGDLPLEVGPEISWGQPVVGRETSDIYKAGIKITASGRRYVDSPAYELQIPAAVAQSWVPEKEFYEMLLVETAMCLSESDPAMVEAAAFEQFVTDNLPTIRAAIDRVKVSQPLIKWSEENWERAQLEL